LAWLTTLPKLGPLPQYSHFIAMIVPYQLRVCKQP
jgi:hypothetical protein